MSNAARTTRLASLALALALSALTACSDTSEQTASPSPSPSSPTTPTSPTTTPTRDPNAPPVLPPAARRGGVKGATAFLRYYIETINYVDRTGDPRPIRRATLPGCATCQSGIKSEVKGHSQHPNRPSAPRRLMKVGLFRHGFSSGQEQFGANVRYRTGSNEYSYEFLIVYTDSWKVAQMERSQ